MPNFIEVPCLLSGSPSYTENILINIQQIICCRPYEYYVHNKKCNYTSIWLRGENYIQMTCTLPYEEVKNLISNPQKNEK